MSDHLSDPLFVLTSYCCSAYDEKYLLEAVYGILNQTDQRFQVILVDDCSPLSTTPELLRTINNLDPRIHVHQKTKRAGVSSSRNYGINLASEFGSPFVLFNDGDDISHEQRLKKTREYFEDNEVDMVYSTYIPIEES